MSSFEELLKTPEGIKEAQEYVERLKIEYEVTPNVLSMRKMLKEAIEKLNRSHKESKNDTGSKRPNRSKEMA